MFFENCVLYRKCQMFVVVTLTPLKHHHNETYSQISKIYIIRNGFQIMDVELFVEKIVRQCLKGFLLRYSGRFPRGNPTMTTSTITETLNSMLKISFCNLFAKHAFRARICSILCMREATFISHGFRMRAGPPRPSKRPQN